jgi:hypothetical protein
LHSIGDVKKNHPDFTPLYDEEFFEDDADGDARDGPPYAGYKNFDNSKHKCAQVIWILLMNWT